MADAAPASSPAEDGADAAASAVEPLTLERAYHLVADKVIHWAEAAVRFRIKYPVGPKGYYPAIHAAILAIKQSFDEADVVIPFPIRTLDFGIKGGERLAAVLAEHVPTGTER